MINSSDDLVQQAVALLSSPQPLWNSVSGTVYSWYDEDRLDVGRVHYWRARDAGSKYSREADTPVLGTLEGLYRFWATSEPWQLRLETVREVVSPDREDAHMPDVLVANRWTWWTKRGSRIEAGRWPPDHVVVDRNGNRWGYYGDTVMPDPGPHYRSPGVENLDLLLRPASATRGFTFPSAQWGQEGERTAIQLEAVPRQDEEFHQSVPGLVALGSDGYLITVDAATGIVLDVNILIEGQVARRHRIGELQVDIPIDHSTFIQPDSVSGSP